MAHLHVTLLLLCTFTTDVLPGYIPLNAPGSQILYNGTGSLRHPSGYRGASSYFRSTSISNEVPDKILVGGADHVTILNVSTLDVAWRLTLSPTPSALANCTSNPTAYEVDYQCRNHLGVFPSNPADPSKVVVCGSEAAGTPSCRAVSALGPDLGAVYASVPAPGITPSSPGSFGYGSFFNVTSLNNTNFFAAVGTPTSAYLAFYTLNYTNPTDPNSLRVNMKFRTPTARNWFSDPTTIVDAVKFEYPARPKVGLLADTVTPDEHKFFMVFMREVNDYRLTSDSEVISRVARVCQNDPGSPVRDTGTGYPYPTTFMKAQIFCRRNTLTDDYPSSYTYHYLQSVAFNDYPGGRYSQSQGDPVRLLYGSFTTSPLVGGKTSAICVYSAQDSKDYDTDAGGTSGTVIDAFRLNIINSVTNRTFYNVLVQCDPSGRWSVGPEYADYVTVSPPTYVLQYYQDPLLVLNGVNVVKMAVGQVCVATPLAAAGCLMQDVLFLGTDDGKLMKVVVTSGGTPVIVEEITFDDNNQINQLSIQNNSSSIVVTTDTKVYVVPLERCSYKYGTNCSACIESRDPYCVWNSLTQLCERNYAMEPGSSSSLSSSFNSSLQVTYYQNIHSGVVQGLTCAVSSLSCSLSSVTDPDNKVPDIQVLLVGSGCSSVRVTGPFSNGGTSVTMQVPASGSITLSTNVIGYQNYEVTAISQRGVVGRAVITTRPQAPSATSVGLLVTPLSSTSFRVNVQVLVLTDDIQNYWYQVHYMTTTLSSRGVATFGHTQLVVDPTLTSGVPYDIIVNVTNSQGSTSLGGKVTLPPPPATCITTVTAVTYTTLTLTLTSSMATYPGYTILVNGTKRSDCIVPGATSNVVTMATGATPTVVTLGGLSSFTTYNISVQACNNAGEGPSCGTHVTTLCMAPGRVGSLVLTSNTSQLLRFTWQRPLNPNGPISMYKIIKRCYPTVAGQPTTTTITQPSTTLTISPLQPTTTCCLTVAAVNTCGDGLGTTTCGRTPDAPPSVQNLSAVVLSPRSVALTWVKGQRPGVRYTITSSLGTTANVSDVASFTVEGLAQGVPHSFSVQPASDTMVGARVTVNVTIPFPPAVPVPGTLAMATNSTSSVFFSWSGVGSFVQQYKVYLQCNSLSWTLSVTPPTTNVTIDISHPGADFGSCVATVQAINALGPSGNSSIASTTVVAVPNRAPAPPTSYVRNNMSSGTGFTWATRYPFSLANLTVLSKLTSGYGTSSQSQTYNGGSPALFTTSANTVYSFSTQLCGTWGCGLPSSNLGNFTTSSVLPPPPSDCTLRKLTASYVSLTWSTPVGVATINTSYRILISGPAPELQVDEVMSAVSTTGPQTWSYSELRAETNYVLSIGTIVPTVGGGPLVVCANFMTPSAPPSAPTSLSVLWRGSGLVNLFWQAPPIANGSVRVYEVRWLADPQSTTTCDNSSVVYVSANTSALEYAFSGPNVSVSLLVCVRGYNRGLGGAWAWRRATPLMTTPTSTVAGSRVQPLGSDPGLVVAVLLSFVFMASTAVMAIVVACCCWRCSYAAKWSPNTKQAGGCHVVSD